MEPLTTRVFMNGNSQAVRIPAQLRIDADRVEISRTPDGDLTPLQPRFADPPPPNTKQCDSMA
jgi:virulence-associated protein VagC